MGFFVTMLIHLAAIATLFPELAVKTTDLVDVVVIIQFPNMALAAAAHSAWADELEKTPDHAWLGSRSPSGLSTSAF